MNSSSLMKLHDWTCRPTGYVQSEMHEPQNLAEFVEDSAIIRPQGFGVLREHRWSITLQQSFQCNDAQLQNASENAAKIVMHEIYGPIENEVRVALSASWGGDTTTLRTALQNILMMIER